VGNNSVDCGFAIIDNISGAAIIVIGGSVVCFCALIVVALELGVLWFHSMQKQVWI